MKAVTAAQLSLASNTVYSVTLDEAIEAMRVTASDMSVKYKETSLSVSPIQCSTEVLSGSDRLAHSVWLFVISATLIPSNITDYSRHRRR